MGVDGRLAFPGVIAMANGKTEPIKTEYRLPFDLGIDSDSASFLRNQIAAILTQKDFGSLTILFSSGGGSTSTSLSLFNFITQLPVPVHMHSTGHVGSSAVPLFAAGSKRTCSPLARFYIHEYHWSFDGEQVYTRVEAALMQLDSDIKFARYIMGSRYRLPPELLNALDGRAKPAILEPPDAKKYGIVEDILELAKTGPDGMNVAIWNPWR
jgi:ATP-dependent protease ClpP protease subunit